MGVGSWRTPRALAARVVELVDLLAALVDEAESRAAELLAEFGLQAERLVAEQLDRTDGEDAPTALFVSRDVRKISGQVGHGLSAALDTGGAGRISSWWTEAAPWRCTVPRQSAPVSPPPMITTCLPPAVIGVAARLPSHTRLDALRKSIAKCTPCNCRPGTSRSCGRVDPPARTSASVLRSAIPPLLDHGRVRRRRPGHLGAGRLARGRLARDSGSRPTGDAGTGADRDARPEHRALFAHLGKAAIEDGLFHLELGDAVAQEPTDPLRPFVDDDFVTRPRELLGDGEAGGARPDDGHPLSGDDTCRPRSSRAVPHSAI